jgi:hypothetical protein
MRLVTFFLLTCLLVAAGAAFVAECGTGGEPSTTAPAALSPEAAIVEDTAPEQHEVSRAPGALPAVGIYPTTIEFDQALRGGEYFKTIGAMNGSDSEQTFRFEVDGEAAPWLSTVDSEDRTQPIETVYASPRGEGRAVLRLAVPEDVPNGRYEGAVRVLTVVGDPNLAEGTGASVNVGAEISVTLDVTGTQKISGSLVDLYTGDVEVGSPLAVRTKIENSGNVQVKPEIDLQVLDLDGNVVDKASFSGDAVYPDAIRLLINEWDTTNQDLGEHIARVSVKFGDLEVGSQQRHFNILAVGTLTRRGELEGLELEDTPAVGSVAKVLANFHNTGDIDTHARFLGEVFRGSVRVDIAYSEELLVARGRTVPLEVFVEVPQDGKYKVIGKVNYEGKETAVQELTFRVGAGEGGLPEWIWLIAGLVALATAALVFGRILIRRSDRSRIGSE